MQKQTEYEQAIKTKYPEQVVIAIAKDKNAKANPVTLGWTMIVSGRPPMMAIAVAKNYYYDAYGKLLSFSDTPSTNLRYAGEMWDGNIGGYNLRSRDYRPDVGLFMTMDTYPGNYQDPLSLHKYLYVHANPINRIDPSGEFPINTIGLAQSMVFGNMLGRIVPLRWSEMSSYFLFGYIPSPYRYLTKPLETVCDKYDQENCFKTGVKNYNKTECYRDAQTLARRYYVRFTKWAQDNTGYHMCINLAEKIMKMNLDSGLKYFSLKRMTNIPPSGEDRTWFVTEFMGAHTVGVFHLCNKDLGKSPGTSDARLHPHTYFIWRGVLEPIITSGKRGWLIP